MSITIYNGYKLPAMNVRELNEFILRFRALAEKKASQLCASALSNLISHDLDELSVFGKEQFIMRNLKRDGIDMDKANQKFRYCSTSLHTYMDMRDRYYEIQRTSRRDPAMDYDCEAIFIPMKDKILALFYAESKELRELFKSQKEVAEYGYWNNVEPPEKVTDEEWKEREKIWLQVWSNDKQARELGMNILFVKGLPERHEIELEDIVANMSSIEERAKYVAWNKLYDDKFREMKGDSEDYLDVDRQVSRWMRSDDGKEELQKQIELCQNIIIPQITAKHLRQNYQEIFIELSKEQD
jgi:hypothetical protein